MSDVTPPATEPPQCRKPWHKPEVSVLPVEETAHNASSGNDGFGGTSFS